jgi:hypothetical protein
MKFINKHIINIIFTISFLVIGLTLFAYWKNQSLNWNYYLGTDKLGHFGDFVGGFLGTFLTIIATIYIYRTFNAQKKSIEIQEEQLSNQKEELQSQKEELILQRKLIAQQQFETTFFNMLNVHRELKKGLNLNISKRISNYEPTRIEYRPDFIGANYIERQKDTIPISDFIGLEVFNFIHKDFNQLYNYYINLSSILVFGQPADIKILSESIKNELINSANLGEIEIINKIFWIIFYNYRNILSHYFRNVYHILKFIRENEIQNNLSYQKYADIFQSQLNEDEQFLLFYNFIAFDDEEKQEFSTVNLCNHYKFLENLGHENLLDNEKHNNKNFYKFLVK